MSDAPGVPSDALDPDDLRARIAASGYHRAHGAELVEVEPGRVVMRVRLSEPHLNPQGLVHGGVIAGLIDSVCGIALRTLKGRDVGHVTIGLQVNYLKASGAGDLLGTGRVVRNGRRTGFSEAEVHDPDGNLVAKGSATFLNVTADP